MFDLKEIKFPNIWFGIRYIEPYLMIPIQNRSKHFRSSIKFPNERKDILIRIHLTSDQLKNSLATNLPIPAEQMIAQELWKSRLIHSLNERVPATLQEFQIPPSSK